LEYSVHYIQVTEQIKVKFGFITILMAEAVTWVVEKNNLLLNICRGKEK
jgi:hypothetical protein